MAYPRNSLALTLEDVDRTMDAIRFLAVQLRTELAAGNTAAPRIVDCYVNLRTWKDVIVAAGQVQGLAEYAQAQKGSPSLNIVTEFNAVVAAIDGVTGWIGTNFPRDGSGYLLDRQFSGNSYVYRTFAPASTAGLRTVLDTLIASIA